MAEQKGGFGNHRRVFAYGTQSPLKRIRPLDKRIPFNRRLLRRDFRRNRVLRNDMFFRNATQNQ